MKLSDAQLKGPYACHEGLSFESFGEMIKHLQEDQAYGRTPVMNGEGYTFHVILYNDNSWRVTDPQLDLFEESSIPPDASPRYAEYIATKSPHTLT